MTCDVEWRKPFDADHARALREALDTSPDGVESITQLFGEMMALRRPTGGVADPYAIVDHVMDRTGVQRKDGWLPRHGAKGVVQLVRRDGTDMTEVLGHDQIGLRLPQQMVFQPIEPLSRRHKLTHLSVDVGAGQSMRGNHRFNHDGHVSDRWRVVALVTDSDQLIAQAKQGDHFGRTGKQRADSHITRFLYGRPQAFVEFAQANL